jgi:hypothetical protein
MAFSVSRSRPFRSLGLYKSNGKHAAPKGSMPASRRVSDGADAAAVSAQNLAHHPAHAATSPRLTTANTSTGAPVGEAAEAEKAAA